MRFATIRSTKQILQNLYKSYVLKTTGDNKKLGRWGSVINKNNNYGYDCANEFAPKSR